MKSTTKNLILTALFAALCIALPQAFHAIPNSGKILSPMHIPVILCGMICGWQYGIVCAIFGPTLSAVTTGMPNMTSLPSMIVECTVYAFVSGICTKHIKTGNTYADLYISLAIAMIAGRLVGGVTKAVIALNTDTPYTLQLWVTGYFVKSLPAIVLQLALIPNVIFALTKARLIEQRYPQKTTDKEPTQNNAN